MIVRCPECGIRMRYRLKTNDWVCLGGCKTIISDAQALQNIHDATKKQKPETFKPGPVADASSARFETMNFERK